MVVLVIEGGSLRASYAAGVLAALEEARVVPEAIDLRRAKDPMAVLHASSAIPLIAEAPVEIDGGRWYDGGFADPVPVAHAIAEGASHMLVIANRPHADRAAEPKLTTAALAFRAPTLRDLIRRHHELHKAAFDLAASPPPGVRVRSCAPRATRRPSAPPSRSERDGAPVARESKRRLARSRAPEAAWMPASRPRRRPRRAPSSR